MSCWNGEILEKHNATKNSVGLFFFIPQNGFMGVYQSQKLLVILRDFFLDWSKESSSKSTASGEVLLYVAELEIGN